MLQVHFLRASCTIDGTGTAGVAPSTQQVLGPEGEPAPDPAGVLQTSDAVTPHRLGHDHAVPRSPSHTVRLRQTPDAGQAAEEAEIRGAQGVDIHADDQNVGRAGGVLEFPRAHLLAARWYHQS